jgi:2-polyprenyl-3-methyl-5-hydroxy-6-metoxy-1,4-benzoquinol methylase
MFNTNSSKAWDMLYKRVGDQSPYSTDIVENIIKNIPSDVSSIFDAGCGAGDLLNILNSKGKYSLYGVDFSSTGVKHCVEEYGIKADVGNLETLPHIPDDSFDLVICSEVLEHIPTDNLNMVIDTLFRVAKKYIIFSNPYREELTYYNYKCSSCSHSFHPSGHIHSVDKKFMRSILVNRANKLEFNLISESKLKFNTFAHLLQTFGYSVINYAAICPSCNETNHPKKWSFLIRVFGVLNKSVTNILFNLGFKRFNNIITIAYLKKQK